MVFLIVLVSVLVQGVARLPAINVLGMPDQQLGWAPAAEALPLEGIKVDRIEIHFIEGLFINGRRLVDAHVPKRTLVVR